MTKISLKESQTMDRETPYGMMEHTTAQSHCQGLNIPPKMIIKEPFT